MQLKRHVVVHNVPLNEYECRCARGSRTKPTGTPASRNEIAEGNIQNVGKCQVGVSFSNSRDPNVTYQTRKGRRRSGESANRGHDEDDGLSATGVRRSRTVAAAANRGLGGKPTGPLKRPPGARNVRLDEELGEPRSSEGSGISETDELRVDSGTVWLTDTLCGASRPGRMSGRRLRVEP